MVFEEKFIAFIDLLGFSHMVAESEAGRGITVLEIADLLSKLGTSADSYKFQDGATTCPLSTFIRKDLNFKVNQDSDSTIISAEVSPAGVINLIDHCSSVVKRLMFKGVMCRGYITKGKIAYINQTYIGSGFIKAYKEETNVTAFQLEADHLATGKRSTPFVEIDPLVCEYIEQSTDDCVREMFNRTTKTRNNITALFPFNELTPWFAITPSFVPDREKMSIENAKAFLGKLIGEIERFADRGNEKAWQKGQYYIEALSAQLDKCDQMLGDIDNLSSRFPKDSH